MSLLCRINKSKLRNLTRAFHTSQTLNRTTNVANNSTACLHRLPPPAFCINTRSFAAPIQFQVKQKKEETDTDGPRLNEKIRTPFLRLVTDDGHSVVSRDEALRRAMSMKLDLVEVDKNAKPPVCKIMDYHKEKYQKERELKEKERAKSKMSLKKGDSKEVRFTGKIEEKDMKIKAEGVIRLMERGYRVKCMAMGKEDEDLGGLLSRFIPLVEDMSIVETGPHVGRTQAYMVVRHVKFGHTKKGKKNKAAETTDATLQSATLLSEKSNPDKGSDYIPFGSCTQEGSDAASGDDFDGAFKRTNTPVEENIVSAPRNSFSSIDSVTSGSLHPRRDMIRSPTPEASVETVNRYKKSEPRNQLPPTRSEDIKNTAARDTFRVDNQFSDHKRPSMVGPRTVQTDAAFYRNSRVSPLDTPRQDINSKVPPFDMLRQDRNSHVPPFDMPRPDRNSHVPPVDISRQESPSQGSSGRGFGLFSRDINQHGGKGNINGEENSRYSIRDSRSGGLSAGQKSTGLNSDHSKGQATDRSGEAGFGIFSRELKR